MSKWDKCFSDTTITAAIIDRAIHHATIINHEGKTTGSPAMATHYQQPPQ
ncbi:ATP-binding protein [Trueperella pyogenes]